MRAGTAPISRRRRGPAGALRAAGRAARVPADALVWRLAWRNAWRNARRTGIVVAAVAVGISGAVLTMAVNYGMVFEMIETAIATELGHLRVQARGYQDDPSLERRLPEGGALGARVLGGLPGVRAWAPRVRGDGLLFSPRASVGVRIVGIDPEREARVSLVARSITAGDYLDGARRVLIGEDLAERLQVGTGDRIVLSAQDLAGDLTGEAYRVGGLFRTPSSALDRSTVFLQLEESQRLLGLGGAISELVVVADRRGDIPGIRSALRERLGARAEVLSWEELQPLLVYMIDSFDATGWVVYAAVFVAMAFGIANVMLMAVYERVRELGIQAAIGMTPRRIVGMVVLESVLLTLVGVALGFALVAVALFSLRDGIDLSFFAEGLGAYGIPTRIRPVVRPYDVVVPTAVALLTGLLASLWPAFHAVRFRPAEALRHL